MSDLRTNLERLGERATTTPDAFERLERRRRRKERNRRIGAGALAFVLVVGGSLVAFGVFRGGGDPTPGGGGPAEGFFALWPETTREGVLSAQAQVERGEMRWRTDPVRVAEVFATSVLGWRDPRLGGFSPSEPRAIGPGLVAVEIALCPANSNEGCLDGGLARVSVVLSEIVPNVWSVIQVDGTSLHTGLPVGAVVPDRSEVTFPVDLPDGTEVSIAIEYGSSGCRSAQDAVGTVQDGTVTLDVALLGEGRCVEEGGPGLDVATNGLLSLAIMDPPSASALGLFDVEPNGIPDVGYVTDLAAVPVRFVPAEDESTAAVAEFTCDETGTISPSTAVVGAQPDGVHLRLVTLDDRVGFSIVSERGGGWGSNGGDDEVFPIPPGAATVSCSIVDRDLGDVASSATLTVSDPAGSFVPAELSCAAVGQIPEYAEGATGFAGEPVQVVRDHLSGLEFDDAVERAMYPQSEQPVESEQPVVRVVREGDVVAKVTLRGDGQGGWLLDTLEHCDGTQFGWSEETTGVTGPPAGPGILCLDLGRVPPSAGLGDIGADVGVDGEDLGFHTHCLGVPAGARFTIMFRNLDDGIPRNISVYPMQECLLTATVEETVPTCDPGEPIFRGESIKGVDEIVYELGPLDPGIYYFQDDVHPQANGVLVVS